ncbi:thermostable hemolysin [Marinobacteraceae bacterium S3BR75-40.1]
MTGTANTLQFDPQRESAPRRVMTFERGDTPYEVTLHRPNDPGRQKIEAFIRTRFYAVYGARPEIAMPLLVAISDASGTLQAAVGLRPAKGSELFLEQYCDRPIESHLADQVGFTVPRHDIMEIGHLASIENGLGRALFVVLTELLHRWQWRWIVCTGTRHVRNSFQRLRLATVNLGEADPNRLPNGTRGWGSYYDHTPQVLAAPVDEAHHRLQKAGAQDMLFPVTGSEVFHDQRA